MDLILAAACDEARTRADGKLDLVGIFNELTASGFPAAQERMTVVFVVEWGRRENGRKPIRADLVDDDDQKILTIQGHTDVEARASHQPPAQTRLIMPLENVVFPHAGRYHFELKAADEVVRALSLFVAEQPDSAEE